VTLFGGEGCDLYRACVIPGMRANLSTCSVLTSLARRVFLSGGVPLVGLQEEIRGPSGYTPRVFTLIPGWEAK